MLPGLTSPFRTLSLLRSEPNSPRLPLSTAQKNPDKPCELLPCRLEARRHAPDPIAPADIKEKWVASPGGRVSSGIRRRLLLRSFD